MDRPDRFNKAFLYDLVYLGFIEVIQMLCDVILTYSRYLILYKNDPTWTKYFVVVYVGLILTSTWFPFYSLVPIFANVNSQELFKTSLILYDCIYVPGTFFFNLFFTGQFVRSILALRRNEAADRDRKLEGIAIRSIVHSLSS